MRTEDKCKNCGSKQQPFTCQETIITIIIINIILVITFTHGIYNYIYETSHVPAVYSVASVLYNLQFVLHAMLFRPCNMFCTFTLALPAVCVQCPIWLLSAVPQFRAFPFCCSGTVWVILRCFQSPLFLPVSLFFHIPHALNFCYEVFIF